MKTSIATVCISGGLREKLAVIASAGFDEVEIGDRLHARGGRDRLCRALSSMTTPRRR